MNPHTPTPTSPSPSPNPNPLPSPPRPPLPPSLLQHPIPYSLSQPLFPTPILPLTFFYQQLSPLPSHPQMTSFPIPMPISIPPTIPQLQLPGVNELVGLPDGLININGYPIGDLNTGGGLIGTDVVVAADKEEEGVKKPKVAEGRSRGRRRGCRGRGVINVIARAFKKDREKEHERDKEIARQRAIKAKIMEIIDDSEEEDFENEPEDEREGGQTEHKNKPRKTRSQNKPEPKEVKKGENGVVGFDEKSIFSGFTLPPIPPGLLNLPHPSNIISPDILKQIDKIKDSMQLVSLGNPDPTSIPPPPATTTPPPVLIQQPIQQCQTTNKIKRIIHVLIKHIDKTDQKLYYERQKCTHNDKQLGEIFDLLVRKFRKLKKTKEEMTKYCMRKAFKFLTDKHKKSVEGKDTTDFLKQYFDHMETEAFSVPFKKNSEEKTMNTNFLKKVFSSMTFVSDYKQYLKIFNKLVEDDNLKKIKYLTTTIKMHLMGGTVKKLETVKRLPWTQTILDKTIELANNLITHSPLFNEEDEVVEVKGAGGVATGLGGVIGGGIGAGIGLAGGAAGGGLRKGQEGGKGGKGGGGAGGKDKGKRDREKDEDFVHEMERPLRPQRRGNDVEESGEKVERPQRITRLRANLESGEKKVEVQEKQEQHPAIQQPSNMEIEDNPQPQPHPQPLEPHPEPQAPTTPPPSLPNFHTSPPPLPPSPTHRPRRTRIQRFSNFSRFDCFDLHDLQQKQQRAARLQTKRLLKLSSKLTQKTFEKQRQLQQLQRLEQKEREEERVKIREKLKEREKLRAFEKLAENFHKMDRFELFENIARRHEDNVSNLGKPQGWINYQLSLNPPSRSERAFVREDFFL